jgi:tetratricopeptide (TPR) repeat protein
MRASLVRSGEPSLRMVAERDGVVMEISQLDAIVGTVRFLFERNRPTLVPASMLCRKGNELASQGKYDDALGFYRDAGRSDPYDPDCHYQAGVTLMLLERYPQAIDEYEKVCSLAPGRFNIGNDLWVAQELLAGRLTHEAFLADWALEHAPFEPQEKLKLVDQAIARFPAFSNLYLHRALILRAMNRTDDAIRALEDGLATHPEPDVRSRLLAQRAALSPSAEHVQRFAEILKIPNANLMSSVMAEVMVRQALPSAPSAES